MIGRFDLWRYVHQIVSMSGTKHPVTWRNIQDERSPQTRILTAAIFWEYNIFADYCLVVMLTAMLPNQGLADAQTPAATSCQLSVALGETSHSV